MVLPVKPSEEIHLEPLVLGGELSPAVDCFDLIFDVFQPAPGSLRHLEEMVIGHRSADTEELVHLTALVFV